ncbi:MAG: hypothetical protein EZS28_037157, partial [Streblomastix strix]
RGQSKDVQSIVGETKEAPVLAGSEDLALEREDQLQAIHIQRMAQAGAWQTIAGDRTGIMNAFLSIHHTARVLARDAQQRREVAVAPKDAKRILSGGGGITSLFGDESKRILAEVVKTQRLIDSQRSVESKAEPAKQVSVKQEVPTQNDNAKRRIWGTNWRGSYYPNGYYRNDVNMRNQVPQNLYWKPMTSSNWYP